MADKTGRYNINLKDFDEEIRQIAKNEERTYSNTIKKLLKEAITARKSNPRMN
jgi:hypothetical protein